MKTFYKITVTIGILFVIIFCSYYLGNLIMNDSYIVINSIYGFCIFSFIVTLIVIIYDYSKFKNK